MKIYKNCISASLLLLLALAGCKEEVRSPDDSKEETATYKKFISGAGHEIIAPGNWTVKDTGSNWTLYSTDGQASINIYTALKKGSGSIEDFKKLYVSHISQYDPEKANWTDISGDNWKGSFTEVLGTQDEDACWDIFIVESEEYYLALVINSSSLSRKFNKDFYINILKTFKSAK